jgi:phenylpyruvate tautomerase PptA (4-oxalocrotonate tautomerase family)
MPVIMLHSLELLEEQKKRIAKKYTQILSEETKVPEERIYCFFSGYSVEDIAAGGVLNSEVPDEIMKGFVTKYSEELKKIDKRK